MIRDEELVIIGDEAWHPLELEEARARHERKRDRDRMSAARRREHNRAYAAGWRDRNRERVREISRNHMRRKRALILRTAGEPAPRFVGSLHSLACTGPTRNTGCRCSKVRCYDKPR